MTTALSPSEIAALDPYQFMAAMGKRVIHPGGKRSTEELFRLAAIEPGNEVLEVGCGVGTTAIELVRRFDASVTAIDVNDAALARAEENARAAGVADRVTVERGDVLDLSYPDQSFDRVIAEAVTMFVAHEQAAKEIVRVCRAGGRIADHEFVWRKPPTPEIRRVFMQEMCPGIAFDTTEDWRALYERAGLDELEVATGPFVMMTPAGFVRDEGISGTVRVAAKMFSKRPYRQKIAWMMPRIMKSKPYLGYVVVAGTKPAAT